MGLQNNFSVSELEERLRYLCDHSFLEGDIDTDEVQILHHCIQALGSTLSSAEARRLYELLVELESIVERYKLETLQILNSNATAHQQVSMYGKSNRARSRYVYRQA